MSKRSSKASTAWGAATIVEEIRVSQRAGEKRFASVFQLLEDVNGEVLVRIAYSTDGVDRRGPVTLRAGDLEKLRTALSRSNGLGPVLGWAEAGA